MPKKMTLGQCIFLAMKKKRMYKHIFRTMKGRAP